MSRCACQKIEQRRIAADRDLNRSGRGESGPRGTDGPTRYFLRDTGQRQSRVRPGPELPGRLAWPRLPCCGKMPSLRRAGLPGSFNLPKQLRMSPSPTPGKSRNVLRRLDTRRGPFSIEQPGHGVKAMRQGRLFITNSHREADPRPTAEP